MTSLPAHLRFHHIAGLPRRHFLAGLGAIALGGAAHGAPAEPSAARQRLAAAWRLPDGGAEELDRVGMLEI
ncbi:MAG: hypothetical protein AB7U92_20540, partial [Piscinibacter sp.]